MFSLIQSSTEEVEMKLFTAFSESIEQFCNCHLSATPVTVACFSGSRNKVLLQTRLQQTSSDNTNMSQLVSVVQQWVEDGSNLEVGGNILQSDPSCDIQGPTCDTEEQSSTKSYKKLADGLAIGYGAIGASLVITAILIVAVLLVAKYKPWRQQIPVANGDLAYYNRALE